MKIFSMVIVLVIFVLAVGAAVNIRKKYCNNKEFIGNRPSKYPHLHCGKGFLTLSRSKSNHKNIQGCCNKVNEVLGSRDHYYGHAADPQSITAVLRAYQRDDCPVVLLQF